MNSNSCIFEFDKSFDVDFLVGTDEAGRGPAAGGVFAAAVHINDFEIAKDLAKLNDSKKLTAKVREELYDVILNNTINSVVCVEILSLLIVTFAIEYGVSYTAFPAISSE